MRNCALTAQGVPQRRPGSAIISVSPALADGPSCSYAPSDALILARRRGQVPAGRRQAGGCGSGCAPSAHGQVGQPTCRNYLGRSVAVANAAAARSAPTAEARLLRGMPQDPGEAASDVAQIEGGHVLEGRVHVSGSKNAVLALMAAALLADGASVVLDNVPDIRDVREMAAILRSLGARVNHSGGGGALEVASGGGGREGLSSAGVDKAAMQRLRGGFLVLGPLVARTGHARLPLPGGCAIGARPVDLHLAGLEAMGARTRVWEDEGEVEVVAPPGGLRGAAVSLHTPSVGATEALMMAGAAAWGDTVISNAAREPEVIELAGLINAMGGRVEGAGSGLVRVRGAGPAGLGGAAACVSPDRIEAGTLLMAGAITGSCIEVAGVQPAALASCLALLEGAGCNLAHAAAAPAASASASAPGLATLVLRPPRWGGLQPLAVSTGPFPAFPTDLQPQATALATACSGASVVVENVFEERMRHVAQLAALGAAARVEGGRTAHIVGGARRLVGGRVAAGDLRAGAALVLAGLSAEGGALTLLRGMSHVDRGYHGLEAKLASLGARIQRLP